MKVFEFTLVLKDVKIMTDVIAESLFIAGCDDSSPRSSEGVASVDFDRESVSLEAAISSAVADVKRAGFGVSRVEISEEHELLAS